HEDALAFANSKWARELSALGTSCPDHFLRTRVCPMFIPWDSPNEDANILKLRIQEQVVRYRADYKKYYNSNASADSPKLRDTNPSVVIVLVIGGASGIGREVALLLARKGAHIVVADFDEAGAQKVAEEAGVLSSRDQVVSTKVNLGSAQSLGEAVKFTIAQFGGIDGVVNTAAIYPVPGADGELTETQWGSTFLVNVTGNYLLARESDWVFKDQNLPSSMVLTSSA